MAENHTPGHRVPLSEIGKRNIRMVRSRGIYVLPNSFTTASLFCAFYAIVQAMGGEFAVASIAIFLSMLFDGCDGRVARLTHTASEFGVQYDSIADMTAFGVAPALVIYQFALSGLGKIGWAAAFIYCLGAALRLARFNTNVNVVDKRFFQGLPSPAAAALVAGFVWLAADNKLPEWAMDALPWVGAFVAVYAGLTMVCNAPFFSGKSLAVIKTVPFWFLFAGAILFILISSNPPLAVFIIFCLYSLSGYLYQAWLWWKGRPNPVKPERSEA